MSVIMRRERRSGMIILVIDVNDTIKNNRRDELCNQVIPNDENFWFRHPVLPVLPLLPVLRYSLTSDSPITLFFFFLPTPFFFSYYFLTSLFSS
jgi:hypothetical protein